MMMKKRKNSGQATMELMCLLLAFLICFLGLVVVMGLSIANIEVFCEAKFKSEQNAENADTGGDGVIDSDILSWKYTKYHVRKGKSETVDIPFLPEDAPVSIKISNTMNMIKTRLNAKEDSSTFNNPDPGYIFHDFKLNLTGKEVWDTENKNFENAYLTANLLGGKAASGKGIAISSSAEERLKMYNAIEKILNLRPEVLYELQLEDKSVNKVYIPAMKVQEK